MKEKPNSFLEARIDYTNKQHITHTNVFSSPCPMSIARVPFDSHQALLGYIIITDHLYAFLKSRGGWRCGGFTNKQTNFPKVPKVA